MQRDRQYTRNLITILIFVFLGFNHSYAMELLRPEREELYRQALALRNEEKFDEAAEMFQKLAYLGNSRAMDNLAKILYDKKRYDEATHWYSFAAELGLLNSQTNLKKMRKLKTWQPQKILDPHKIELHVVVGSKREGQGLGPVFSVLNGTKAADNSLINAFDGRATTLDLEKCALPNVQHITADATNFDFTKYNVKAAYLERLPTYTHSVTKAYSSDPASLVTAEHNTTGKIINNIAKAMESGSLLEIEWHPYVMLIGSLTEEQLHKFRTINPFHGYVETISPIVISMGAIDSVDEAVLNKISVEQKNFIGFAKGLLELYRKEGVQDYSMEKIKRSISEEFIIYDQALRDMNKHSEVIKQVLENSLTGALLVDLTVLANSPYVVTYLTSHGFENVSISRMTSERNGRKNVWIIKATKS